MKQILRAKVAVVGEPTVGKTALTQMFLSDGRDFPKSYEMTFGTDLVVKTVYMSNHNDAVELFLYDSSGQSFDTEIIYKNWNQPNMFMVVYDITNLSSFNTVPQWVNKVLQQIGHSQDGEKPTTLGVIVGNKVDLSTSGRRAVSTAAGVEQAKKLKMQHFECSAKENIGISAPFEWLAQEWHKMFMNKVSSFHRIN